ncbi:MAG: hypothetical protein QXJ06_06225 [Candidatus Aenigmatarchaeota archaeon]
MRKKTSLPVNINIAELISSNFPAVIDEYFKYQTIREQEETKRVEITAKANIEIERIRQQALILSQIFEKTFDERKEALNSFIKVLDHGIEQSNPEIINYALNSICFLIKENPVKMIKDMLYIVERKEDEIVEI